MEGGLELDDDVFFKDLSKQISLLIMDDDEPADSLVHRPSLNLQGYNNQGIINPARQEASSFVSYDNHNHNQNQTSKRDQSKGTGVFIPRSSSNPRRKNVNKQGRFNKPQISRADHNNTQYMGYNNINNNSNYYNNINLSHDDNSFNLRRF
ncbi:hypothetical protein ABFX02_07G028000 [Erythranthe guttata]